MGFPIARYGRRMPKVRRIRECFASFEPERVGGDGVDRAAVAVVLREGDVGAELLFIERATRSGDPWSGHMAFPGGRLEAGDPSSRAAAERETLEEVGLSLGGAEYLGSLGDIQGHRRFNQNHLVVSAHVFFAEDPGPIALQFSEVRSSLWFPLQGILDRERHVAYRSGQAGDMEFPGVLVGEPGRHVVWGLTYRFLELFMDAIEHPLPDRSAEFDFSKFAKT
jgi:8-oxo-dGTP pyrophosphatase MutT (NUDIX family)